MSLRCTAVSALFAVLGVISTGAQAHPEPAGTPPAAAVAGQPANGKALDVHTREDIERHQGMARAHSEAAQCLASGRKSEDCTKQLQASCKGLALGKNCGMRHSH